jgi:hypothetical protein
MKKIVFTYILYIITIAGNTQTNDQLELIKSGEIQLSKYAQAIMEEDELVDRLRADSFFTRTLVKSLQVPYSFNYPFDSLNTISKRYAPDSSFRIITWQVMKDPTYFRYKGAIQMKTADGALKLIPLFDGTHFTENPVDSVRNPKNWIGAIYYNIILKKYNNKKYYTLLGFDEHDENSSRKWIEVLTFDNNQNPVFGGRYFLYPKDPIKPKQPAFRFYIEYKKDAAAKLNYDPEMDMIIFAKLVSESNEPEKKQTLVPYGTIEGFKWQEGKWVYVPEQ